MTDPKAEQQGQGWRWVDGVILQSPTGERFETRFIEAPPGADEDRRRLLVYLNSLSAALTDHDRLVPALEHAERIILEYAPYAEVKPVRAALDAHRQQAHNAPSASTDSILTP